MLGLRLLRGQLRSFPSTFRSADGWRQFLAAYEAALADWNPPARVHVLGTRFGRTRVHECGPAEAPELILLHGFSSSSTMWAPTIAALGRRYRVWAPDTLGDAGLSEPIRWPAGRADYVTWLTDVLAELGVGRARWVGFSYGAWLAVAMAAAQPERVDRLALLDAVGFAPLRWPVLLIGALAAASHSRQLVQTAGRLFRTDLRPASAHDELFLRGLEHFNRRRWVAPALFSDGELRRLSVPALALWGERDPLMDTRQALDRARRLVPDLQAGLLAGIGHGVYRAVESVNPRLLDFLDGQPAPPAPRVAP